MYKPRSYAQYLLATLSFITAVAQTNAQTSVAQNTDIVTWTSGKISIQDIDADLLKLPPSERTEMRKNPRLLLQVIDNLQVYRELAARAKAAGNVNSEVAKSAEIAAERQIGLLYLNDLLYKYRAGLGDLTKAAREQYDTNKSKYERPERVNASHILIAPRGRTKEAAQKLAENLREQIAKGADLGALAKMHSDDKGTKDNSGVLGTFPRGTMIKPFDEAVFKLTRKGELAPIVESQFGYHVIQLNTRSAAGLATFDDVKEEIIDELANKAVNQYRDVILSGIRNDASMKINESAFETMTGARPTRRTTTQGN